MSDLRLAVRGLAKAPSFTLAVVAVLALGIGASTIVFSIAHGVLLKPLPFPNASRLLAIETVSREGAHDSAYLDVMDWRTARTLEAAAPYSTNAVTLTGRGDAASLPIAIVDGDFFPLLAPAPLRGRILGPADFARGAPRAAILSEATWRRRFGADETIVGRTITLDAEPFTVAGIMPAAFEFPYESERVEAWIPIRSLKFTAQLADQRGASFLSTVARLRAGHTVEEARTELTAIQARLAGEYPESNGRRTGVIVTPLQRALVRDYRLALVILLAAVGFVLLIACANVANLLLARGTSRRREMAVRAALGAGRGRLVRQLLTESVVLSLAGGAAGVLFAIWGLAAFVAATPINVPRLQTVHVDGSVLVFAVAASIATGLLFGIAPALQLSNSNTVDALKDEARGSGGRGAARTRRTLVAAEMALSVVLLVGAGLLLRSLLQLQRVNPGFVSRHVVGMFMTLGPSQRPIPFTRRLLEALHAIPGVENAAIATTLPMSGDNVGIGFTIEGRPADPAVRTAATAYAVSAEYFETMRIRVLRGRAFTDRDNETAPNVIIINDTMARTYWPNEDPVGQRMRIGYNNSGPREIVGVVADVKSRRLSDRPEPQIYTTYAQTPWPFVTAVARASGDPAGVARQLRAALASVDPSQAAADVKPLDAYVAQTVATPRFTAAVTAAFAAMSLLLAAIGLYALMACTVGQRRRELGIRMALGAQPGNVRGLVVADALRLGGIGLLVGLAGALAAARLISASLFDVAPTDPMTFVGVSGLLAAVLLAAAYLPARRATRIDPAVALRAD